MGFVKPAKDICSNKSVGPTNFDSFFKNQVPKGSDREKENRMAPSITVVLKMLPPTHPIQILNSLSIKKFQLAGAAQSSTKVVTSFKLRPSKGKKKGSSPKIPLKHFIRKQKSFDNVWTALLKSKSLVACSFKATKEAPQQNLIIKPSLSENNPNLLEACSSKVRIDTLQNRSVTAPPAPKLFSYSSFTDPNTKIILLRGSPCHSVDSVMKKSNTELVSPYSGSSEESAGLKYT